MKRLKVLAVIYRLEQGDWKAYANGVWFSLTIELHESNQTQTSQPSYQELRIHGIPIKKDESDNQGKATFDLSVDLISSQCYWDQVEPQKK